VLSETDDVDRRKLMIVLSRFDNGAKRKLMIVLSRFDNGAKRKLMIVLSRPMQRELRRGGATTNHLKKGEK